ncbi:MAG: Holliday junction branch migration protein RuvA [Victivallales bacterium]|nr:Holliday junction branch migration protein RuvA [Victivallales bacterium]
MIAKLTGILSEADFTQAVVDVNGVGYLVFIPLSTFDKLPRVGEKATLFTQMTVKEDAITLYGFATREERELFVLLTGTVSGIGPKLALNVLSCMTIRTFAEAIAAQDIKALGKINGIGKKTAERMVLELRDKVASLGVATGANGLPGKPTVSPEAEDALAALETLGFKHDAAEKTIHALCGELADQKPSAEQLIRLALARLNS